MRNTEKTPRQQKTVRIAIALVALLAIAAIALRMRETTNQKSRLATILAWTGLNSYPVPENEINIEQRGSMFTREFNAHFQSAPEVVERWLSQSSCTASITPTMEGTTKIYNLKPVGGAQFAEIRTDLQSGEVRIRTYWN